MFEQGAPSLSYPLQGLSVHFQQRGLLIGFAGTGLKAREEILFLFLPARSFLLSWLSDILALNERGRPTAWGGMSCRAAL